MGAFFLCMGGDLRGIRIKDAARGIAAFEIGGENLDRLDHEYRSGRALVNPVQLRESLNLLRDMLFDPRETRSKGVAKGSAKGSAITSCILDLAILRCTCGQGTSMKLCLRYIQM